MHLFIVFVCGIIVGIGVAHFFHSNAVAALKKERETIEELHAEAIGEIKRLRARLLGKK